MTSSHTRFNQNSGAAHTTMKSEVSKNGENTMNTPPKNLMRENTVGARRCMLMHALTLFGMSTQIREDSKLCKAYIYEGKFVSPRYNNVILIARRMAEMHFLYNYTNYPTLVKEKFEERRYFGKEHPHYIPPQTEAEFLALKGQRHPVIFPWQKQQIESKK